MDKALKKIQLKSETKNNEIQADLTKFEKEMDYKIQENISMIQK